MGKTERVKPKTPVNPADEYIPKIKQAWQKSVEGIIEAGRLLVEAKKVFGKHGKWEEWIDANLPFKHRTAEYLMKIAGNEALANPHTCAQLPPYWRTLGELASIPPDRLRGLIKDGSVNPEMTVEEAKTFKDHPVAVWMMQGAKLAAKYEKLPSIADWKVTDYERRAVEKLLKQVKDAFDAFDSRTTQDMAAEAA